VLWAEHVTKNTARSRDDVFDRVRSQFSDAEIVELTLVSGYFNLFNRLMDSLRVPLETSDEVDLIKRSVHLDPVKVKRYLRRASEEWPEVPRAPGSD
jgi:hypothetical protein